ncbi:hypothetical protein GCM10022403_056190 [Streptomyces coacervatus]|uniref:Serine/arginine repetitive matrix protein 2 n=1 Tax=Streptomyces coacervatus TaxID=647381 RepID=A0ABP7ID74_9ACTN|nr:hypothetical protein [Streptomyces coacervatus]MDF2269017.1 hypothetical protein [Streptomyces coacervatus]
MSGWDGYSSGSGAGHEPSEDRGQAAWNAQQPPPDWASAETQVNATPPWSAPPPAPYPHPPVPRRRTGLLLAALTAAVVLGAGLGAGIWLVVRDHSTGTGATPAASISVTATTTPPQSPTPTPTSTPTASASLLASSSPSAGYRRAQDPVGYGIDVPQGWNRRQKQGQLAPVVYYDAPADGRRLQIFQVSESTPYESLTLAETDPGYGFSQQPGYRVIERDRGDTWAELSYRYDSDEQGDKGARQVIDHRFRAADGTLYAIRSSGPGNLDPELVREPLAMAVRSFCPAGADCS